MLFGIFDRQPLFHTGAYLDVAYVFGNMGNLAEGPGAGWSVEDEFAWTIGAESELTLPLPGHDKGCFLRFNVHAAVFFAPSPQRRSMSNRKSPTHKSGTVFGKSCS